MADFTVCVLLYGNHTDLARRCLDSIITRLPPEQYQLRVGLNEVCPATRIYVHGLALTGRLDMRIYESSDNIHKYPLMRRMLHDPAAPLRTPYVIWFDDDSYLIGDYRNWLDLVRDQMARAVMIGGKYTMQLAGNQYLWIRDQPWYTGRPVINPADKIPFITGGWWTLRTEVLTKHDWPSTELDHRGGDVMLGALCRQQGYAMASFREGVAINADAQGHESKAPRRGFDSRPVGFDHDPGVMERVEAATRRPEPVVPVPQPAPKRRRLELDI